MKLSIIVPVLNSHEIVRRSLLHYDKMFLTDDVEVIYVDDGSDPPIEDFLIKDEGLSEKEREEFLNLYGYGYSFDLTIYQTNDKRDWTWALARNFGAKKARGEYLLMTDLDYIIPKKAIEYALQFTGDKLRFKREFGILDENGEFTQDVPTLLKWGLLPERISERGLQMPPHPNNFCMRKDLYWEMGGYREDRVGWPYPQGEDAWFKRKWTRMVEDGKAKDDDARLRPTLYMYPNGQFCGDVDYNPFGLFHKLSRKTERNAKWQN